MPKRKHPNLKIIKGTRSTGNSKNAGSATGSAQTIHYSLTPDFSSITPSKTGSFLTRVPVSSMSVRRGSRHQGDVRYSPLTRNHQCTANAVVALVYCRIENINLWNTNTIDKILDYGDCLYEKSLTNRPPVGFGNNSNYRDLLVIEVYTKFIINGTAIRLILDETLSVSGRVGVETEGPFFTLIQGLTQLFETFDLIVFTAGGLSVAVFKTQSAFFVFDSHSRNETGTHTEFGGTACLLEFVNFANLSNYLFNFHNADAAFSLFPITVQFENYADESYTILMLLNNSVVNVQSVDDDIETSTEQNFSQVSNPTPRRSPRKKNHGIPVKPLEPNLHYLGPMNSRCSFCKALFFQNENKICCSKGAVKLPVGNEFPDLLKALLTNTHPLSQSFSRNIRKYNTLLAFGSTHATLRTDLGQGTPVIVISGHIYHRIANIDPSDPQFGSLYYLDAGEATEKRSTNAIHQGCSRNLLTQIDALLRTINPFAQQYRSLGQCVQAEIDSGNSIPRLGLFFHTLPGTNRKIHCAPSNSNEIGAIFRSYDGEIPPPGQIRVFYNQTGSIDIPKLSPIVDPLCYPLLFPYGELGWSMNMERENIIRRKRISKREFDCYRLMQRENKFNAILFSGKLCQQFIVDKYAELEGDRLYYNRCNQKKLRAESYVGLQDYLANIESVENRVGRVVILPSTFTGGPRYLHQSYHDAMAIVCKYGRPSLFITFTCNPQWREIKDNLGTKLLSPQDRPELIARVFEQKRKAFFEDVFKNKIFGTVIAYVYVIEFQKRGLPHMHCLLTLCDEDKLREPEDVDKFISAELPDEDSRLLNIVLASMIHGPCGDRNTNSPCMENGVCSKGYPKPFAEHTNIDSGKRPQYRRRNNGRFADITRHNCEVRRIDNRDIVPYNPYLSLKYESHINVEVCSNVLACKYIFKYINKGPDAAVIRVENEIVFDEIRAYLDSRYISSGEAAWRLLEFSMQGKSHSIFRLPVHLPGERTVYFEEGEEGSALRNSEEKYSILEAFFKLNEENSEANQYVYCDIPLHFCYNKSQHRWTKRQRKVNVIPRMYTISPKYVEKFHLRILLLHVSGPKSFHDIRTVNGITYNTFQEAAQQRYLVSSDDEWIRTLEHAAQVDMPGSMCKLFAYLLCFCEVGHPLSLWNRFKGNMSEDYQRSGLSLHASEMNTLKRISDILRNLGKTLRDFNLPEYNAELLNFVSHTEDQVEDGRDFEVFHPNQLNADQRRIFDRIVTTAQSSEEQRRYFYLQGSGGTGKTHLYNTLLTHFSSQQIPTVAVAFTGIAALLLKNGRTVHSAFRLPLTLDANSHSSITAQSEEAAALRNIRLIIWDEVSMSSCHILDTVDNLLQDVCNNRRPFGGKCVLLGGDVKQLLPVAIGRVQQTEIFFTNCQSWNYFEVLELKLNMRTDPEEQEFARWLLDLGQGTINETGMNLPQDSVRLPQQCVTDNVIQAIYGDLTQIAMENSRSLSGRAILCPKNDHCNFLNSKILSSFPGATITILSVDTIVTEDEEERANFSEEYLNSIIPNGMPLHQLSLKIGVPVILLRNLSLQDGLINGTRLLVLAITDFLLTAEIVTGRFCGRKVLIPRMDLTSSDRNIPFVLKRRQFPVKLCFALTINKSQGQTFDNVGIYLESPVFSHGQLYVAFSRVRNWKSIKVEVVRQYTPTEADDLELKIDDYLYVTSESLNSSTDSWLEGTSWTTGCSGFFPGSYAQRAPESEAWTLHKKIPLNMCEPLEEQLADKMGDNHSLGADQLKEFMKDKFLTDLKDVDSSSSRSESSESNSQKIFIMRHGERVDFVFGTWIPHCFDEAGNYLRKDLNMPLSLPLRKSGPESYLHDSPLTNLGLFQARSVGECFKLKNINIDHVYCSPSYRCLQTCDSFLQGLGKKDDIQIKVEPTLFEWAAWYPQTLPDWMLQEELLAAGFNIDTSYTQFMSEKEVKNSKESCEDYYQRSYAFTKKVIASEPTGNILMIGHASTLDTCSRELLHGGCRNPDGLFKIVQKIPYCSLIELSFDGKEWCCTEPPSPPMTHCTNNRFDWKILLPD